MLRKAFILQSIVSCKSQSFSGLFGAMIVCGFLMLVMTGNGFAQVTTMALRSPLKIDPREGKLNLTVSFTAGTDRMGSPIVDEMYYSSAVWDIGYQVIEGQSQNYYRASTNYDTSRAGWSSSLEAPTISDDSQAYDYQGYNTGPCLAADCPDPTLLYYVTKKIVSIPGVGTHDLYKDDVPRELNPQNPTRENFGIYNSVDGSRIKYDADTRTLYLPNGSRYLFDTQGTAASYIDRNGNQRTYNKTARSWTDALGRVYNNPMTDQFSIPTAPTDQIYGVPGFGGGASNYVLQWRKLQDALDDPAQQLKYTGDIHCRNSNNNLALPAGESLFQSTQPTSACANYDPLDSTQVARFNPMILAGVVLPNGAKYTFKYSLYGDIVKVEMPEGGYEKYEYATFSKLSNNPQYCTNPFQKILYRQVFRQIISPSGQGGDEITTDIGDNSVWFADGTSQIATTHYVSDGDVCFSSADPPFIPFGFVDIRKSLRTIKENRTRSATNQLLRRTLTDTSVISKTYPRYNTDGRPPSYTTSRDPRTEGQINIVFEPNEPKALLSLVKYEYESNTDTPTFTHLNVTRVKTYDYITVDRSIAETGDYATLVGYFSNQLPHSTQETDYLHDAAYDARHIIGMPSATRIKDKNGIVVAQSEIKYDEEVDYPIIRFGATTNWADPGTNYRGNATTTKSWTNVAANQFVETHAQYDNFGNPRKSWDAKGNFSTTDYSSTYAYAYPTSVTTPVPDASGVNGSTAAFTTSSVYDFNTGLPTSVTDANNQTTQMQYNDALLRPTKTIAPNGHQTITEYGAGTTEATRFVKVRTQIDATRWKEAYSWYDGLGRTVRTQSVDSGGDVFSDVQYDNMGRVKKATNPYRTGETIYWTESFYDDLGRVTKVKTPDNAEVNTSYSLATTAGSQIGTVVTVTDQAGKQRRSITSGLGQLARVDEPNEAGSLGAIDFPAQATAYTYDTLNNLTTVTQGSQTRSFVYDSLSRLKSATNPESGLIQYGYDNNGNLQTKTDARLVTTTYAYDNLNRVLSRSYANEPSGQTATPAVSYFYDNVTNAKGKLIKVSSSVSQTEYTGFDILGRVTNHKQTTDGVAYTTGYSYNLSGGLETETYPSGRVVKNTLDNDGDLSIVQSRKNQAAGFSNYASNFSYTAAGAVSSMQLGNGKWESTVFNSRLQPTQIALGTVQNGTDNLKLNYTYSSTPTSTDNNGNVLSQQITVPATNGVAGFVAAQTYSYDSLNRLKAATENIGGSQSWKQTFTYDRFGNRRFDTNGGNTTIPAIGCQTAVCNPQVDPLTNKLVGYSFDNAGNTTTDASGKTFTYDGENKQTKVMSGSVRLGVYAYDGDGKRVKKIEYDSNDVAVETTIFVYDAGGKMVAEYSTNPAPASTARVSYLTNDHLGSPRVTSGADGKVFSRRDFMPFGEEITSVQTGQRSVNLNYGSDSVRQKFTSYERDNESDLDFAQARFYNPKHGRFTTTDPLLASAKPAAPETWNRFAYVMNNPLKYIDPSGLCSVPSGLKAGQVGICVEAFIASRRLPGKAFLGKGDNRTFSGTDDKLNSRVRLDIIVTPQPESRNHHIEITTTVGVSKATVPLGPIFDFKLQGTATTELENGTTTNGTATFGVNVSATNGLPNLPTAPSESIDFTLPLVVTPEGGVGTGAGGKRDGYPSLAIYSYQYVDGKLVTNTIYEDREGNLSDLAPPMEKEIPEIKPKR